MPGHKSLKLLIYLGTVGVIVAGTLAGCHGRRPYDHGSYFSPNSSDQQSTESSKVKTLRFILEGPWVVITREDDHNRVIAYLPYDSAGVHQLLYPNPATPQTGSKSYHFILSESGLEISHEPPYVDHGFDDFNVTLPDWEPKPADYYVALDLPAPEIISYIPPPVNVLFEPATQGARPRFGRLPESHVLEYRVRDVSKITLHSKELGDRHPTVCHTPADDSPRHEHAEGARRDWELTHCSESASYFMGVRIASSVNSEEHALRFFNDKLLPSMFGPDVPQGRKLLKLNFDPYGDQSPTRSPFVGTTPVPRYALFSEPPRIVLVIGGTSGGGNCSGPGATARKPLRNGYGRGPS